MGIGKSRHKQIREQQLSDQRRDEAIAALQEAASCQYRMTPEQRAEMSRSFSLPTTGWSNPHQNRQVTQPGQYQPSCPSSQDLVSCPSTAQEEESNLRRAMELSRIQAAQLTDHVSESDNNESDDNDPSHASPLDASIVDNLEKSPCSETDTQNDNILRCIICLNEPSAGNAHVSCWKCTAAWCLKHYEKLLRKECPQCRSTLIVLSKSDEVIDAATQQSRSAAHAVEPRREEVGDIDTRSLADILLRSVSLGNNVIIDRGSNIVLDRGRNVTIDRGSDIVYDRGSNIIHDRGGHTVIIDRGTTGSRRIGRGNNFQSGSRHLLRHSNIVFR